MKKEKSKANIQHLKNHLQFLTGLRPHRNVENPISLTTAERYIQQEFENNDASTELQTWEVYNEEYHNVIVRYNPKGKKKLIVGAHYDVCGDQPGADDNGSGVAGLLELASMIFANAPKLNYCIEFVAYNLEEPPYFLTPHMGSSIHAQSLIENNDDVIGMICLDMIGYFSDEPGSQRFPDPFLEDVFTSTGDFIMVVGVDNQSAFSDKVYKLMKRDTKIKVHKMDLPLWSPLNGLSDQMNYQALNIQAVLINDTAFYRNPHYHLESDTMETLDFEKMSEVVNSCYRAIVSF
jgi:Zn-dependent M28 family amino/carboxypeptidase